MVAQHVNGDFAAVYVLTDEGADRLSLVRRDAGGWAEVAGGDGGFLWVDTEDDEDAHRGVLPYATAVDAPSDYLVRYADSTVTIKTAVPYVVAVLLGVVADDRVRVTRLGG